MWALIFFRVSNIGVVIKVEKDQYRVIDQNGTVRVVKPQEIMQKRDSKKAVALDIGQSSIHAADVVEIVSGEFSVRQYDKILDHNGLG